MTESIRADKSVPLGLVAVGGDNDGFFMLFADGTTVRGQARTEADAQRLSDRVVSALTARQLDRAASLRQDGDKPRWILELRRLDP